MLDGNGLCFLAWELPSWTPSLASHISPRTGARLKGEALERKPRNWRAAVVGAGRLTIALGCGARFEGRRCEFRPSGADT